MNMFKGAFTNPFGCLLWLIIVVGWVIFPIQCKPQASLLWAGITLFAILMYVSSYTNDKKKWNNGKCPECEKGFWKSFDCDSQGGTGYNCTYCNNSHWQNGAYDHVIRVKYNEVH